MKFLQAKSTSVFKISYLIIEKLSVRINLNFNFKVYIYS